VSCLGEGRCGETIKSMTKKPAGILYLAGDVPPVAVTIANALQYVAVTSSFLVFPLIIVREAHLEHFHPDRPYPACRR
jgi:hypothetical protein